MSLVKMHEGEFDFDDLLVRRLVAEQFPRWAELALSRVASSGTDNALYRLGPGLAVRLPRLVEAVGQVEEDLRWLPRLAPGLPLTVPEPVGLGQPGQGYPWTWGVYRWIDGEEARLDRLADPEDAARDLAWFLNDLQALDTAGGPVRAAGSSRGGPLIHRDRITREAIADLAGLVDTRAVTAAWEDALAAAEFAGRPVWIHADLQPGNLLVRGGRLAAVIDWSALRVADPACDLAIGWSLFDDRSRRVLREQTGADDAAWARGRGWALSIALIQLPYYLDTNPGIVEASWRTIAAVLADARPARIGGTR